MAKLMSVADRATKAFTEELDQLVVKIIDREKLYRDRCNTAGHGRRAEIQHHIDMLTTDISARRAKLISAYDVMVQP